MNGDSLLPKKLTTMSKQKAIKCAKRSIRKGKLSKKYRKNKHGIKSIRKGLNIKKIALKYSKGLIKKGKIRGTGVGEYGLFGYGVDGHDGGAKC